VVDGKETYPNPRRPDWPKADYIVGNPPFLGKGEPMRSSLGDSKLKALWKASGHVNESADFVMYWWDRAAEILLKPKSGLKRFGFVTTNSISQTFNRRVMEAYLNAKKPLSLVMAIPDHPWTKVTRDSAAVRIAMTVAEAGKHAGRLLEVTAEEAVETDSPVILFAEKIAKINSDLSAGVDVTLTQPLASNRGLASNGVLLAGRDFLIEQDVLPLLTNDAMVAEGVIRPYINGKELIAGKGTRFIIDVGNLDSATFRFKFPSLYQRLAATVKVEREAVVDRTGTKDAIEYAANWFRFAKPRRALREALSSIERYIATTETTKHRHFQFVDARIVPDHMVVAIALCGAFELGVLSSRFHVHWAMSTGGWLGVGNDPRYSKSRCFDPFPFPDASDAQKRTIGGIAEDLDAHRKQVLETHQHLTLTTLYNVLERLKTGASPSDLDPKERRIFDDGLVLILKELHERLDEAVANAYGWPIDLPAEEVLARLVALNGARAKEEKRGKVHWLRPDYQIPRFGSEKEKAEQMEVDFGELALTKPGPKPSFPSVESEQTALVINALIEAGTFVDAGAIAASFRQGQKVRPIVNAVLNSLYRMGLISTADGRSFSWRRVA